MEITLHRDNFAETYIAGSLFVNKDFFCYTLEPPLTRLAHPAIPPGTYELAITFSNRLRMMLPLLLNVPGRSGTRIHALNMSAESQGCIGLGFKRVAPVEGGELSNIAESKLAVSKFIWLLKDALVGQKVFITIT